MGETEEGGYRGRFPSGLQGRGSFIFGAGEGSSRWWTGSWGGRPGCWQGQELRDPRLLPHGSGGRLAPIATPATSLPSQWRCLFTIFPTHLPTLFQTLHVHCCQKPSTPAHFAWGKKKPQVYCWHSRVSKHSHYKKVYIYTRIFLSALSVLFF